MKRAGVKLTQTTGNVFQDVGFRAKESAHLLLRADLLIELQETLESSGVKQAEAAKIMGVTQSRVSDLLRGRIEVFSADTLINMLARLRVVAKLAVKRFRSRTIA